MYYYSYFLRPPELYTWGLGMHFNVPLKYNSIIYFQDFFKIFTFYTKKKILKISYKTIFYESSIMRVASCPPKYTTHEDGGYIRYRKIRRMSKHLRNTSIDILTMRTVYNNTLPRIIFIISNVIVHEHNYVLLLESSFLQYLVCMAHVSLFNNPTQNQ